MEKKMYIPLEEDTFSKFVQTNIAEQIEAHVKAYNEARLTETYGEVNNRVDWIGDLCCDCGVYEFARVMAVMELAREGRLAGRIWGLNAGITFANGDIEFCREFSIRNARDGYSQKQYNAIKRESADQNVADILGMITDELGKLDDDDYEDLLDDFAAPLIRWRSLKVPKYKEADAYDAMYEIVQKCCDHNAYRTALRLAGLLYVTDSKKMPNLIITNTLVGKILYELGYMEAAKRCFLFAARDNSKKRRPPFPEEFLPFLNEKTDLEVPGEVYERQKFIDEAVASGKIKVYTEEEVDKFYDKELKIEFPNSKSVIKKRETTAKKALDTYEECAGGSAEERLKGIDEALKVFAEEAESYEQAAYLYFLKANIYLKQDDIDKAYDFIKKAYGCKDGNKNGMVLLTFAIILSKMGRSAEATVYIFRCYILLGEEFVAEKLGDSALEALEDYI